MHHKRMVNTWSASHLYLINTSKLSPGQHLVNAQSTPGQPPLNPPSRSTVCVSPPCGGSGCCHMVNTPLSSISKTLSTPPPCPLNPRSTHLREAPCACPLASKVAVGTWSQSWSSPQHTPDQPYPPKPGQPPLNTPLRSTLCGCPPQCCCCESGCWSCWQRWSSWSPEQSHVGGTVM